MKVYQCINKVQASLAKVGIAKCQNNSGQGYKFRGIDDIYNTLANLLAEYGLCILPKVISREVVERQTARGGVLLYVTVCVEFAFVCAEDGSSHLIVTYGEAMDSGDKATNKAMSAAYKYACLQAFCIPTEGDNDSDATTHTLSINSITYPDLVKLIKLHKLEQSVKDWVVRYSVNNLSELNQKQINELAKEIQNV